MEDAVRSDATPDRSRSRPEGCGSIAFARQLGGGRAMVRGRYLGESAAISLRIWSLNPAPSELAPPKFAITRS